MPLFGQKRKPVSALLAALMLAAACGAAGAQTPAAARRAALIPNARKYGDKGSKPATGRAGTANVAARALLARDRTTEVEVTTGALDSAAPPPGQLSKVQLKTFDQGGAAVYAKNFNALPGGGYFKATLDDARRGQPLQVQANVRGVDGSRTGVVTLLTSVALRPDLRAANLAAPARALKGSQVNIAATVAETNHDAGARARCVLYVDGAAADGAAGVWVDAGDTVTCAFSHLFAEPGTHRLRVSVEEVVPGDYDASNNSAEGSIEVVEPNARALYAAYAAEFLNDYFSSQESYWRLDDGTYRAESDYGYVSSVKQRVQNVTLSSWAYRQVAFPVHLSVREFSDGAEVLVTSFAGVDVDNAYVDYSDGATYRNASRHDAATGVDVYFTSVEPAGGATDARPGFSQMNYYRYAGKATYYSANFARYWDNYSDPQYFYSYNNDTSDPEAGNLSLPSFGSGYALEGSFGPSDGSARYVASPAISLLFESHPYYNNPYACTESASYPYVQRFCGESRDGYTVKYGYAAFYGN